MKLVTTVHGWVQHTRRTPLYYAIDKLCLRRYDEVVCVAKDLYEECLKIGIAPPRCHWVHNGIDTEQFRRHRPIREVRGQHWHPSSVQVIGAMGRLSEEKGFDILIRAVAHLLNQGFDLELWIAGEGGQRNHLQSLIDRLQTSQRIKLLGHVDDAQAFFESLDIFVLSSVREGLPNVLLEAMALEVPVVATRIAGIPSLIQHDKNGLLVEPANLFALTEGLRRLLGDQPLRKRFSREGRQTIEGSFSFERRMRRIAGIYDALLARSPDAMPAAMTTR
jgi:glycosyltransferase involved in cell wall biosynthesis